MNNLFFVSIPIIIVTGLIYFLYKFMLGLDKTKNDNDLQITSEEILEQLKILYKEKNYNIVVSLAKKYLEKKPNNVEIRTILTKALHHCKKTLEAIDQAQQIVRKHPQNTSMKIFLGNCYMELGRNSEAISTFEDILKSDAENVIAIKELAQIYFKTNQKKSSIKMYKKLEEYIYSNQEKCRIKTLLAQMYIEFEEYELAINEYNEILEIYPVNIETKKSLIELFKKTTNYTRLIEIATEIMETHSNDENDLWAIRTLSEAYLKMKDYEKALEYANLIKEHPLADKVLATENIAKILRENGQIDESIEVLASLIAERSNLNTIMLKKSLAQSYEAKQAFDAATNVYKEILDEAGAEDIKQIHFEMSNIYADWAMHLFNTDDTANCFKKFTIAIQYDSTNPKVYYNIGQVNQAIKNFNEAISQYKKAIELDNENPIYYMSTAECYEELNNVYEERKALAECAKYDKNNARVFYKLALLYEKQNDYINALLSIQKALEIDENFLDAKYKLALIYEHQGKKDEAIELYEDILKWDPEYGDAAINLKMLKT